MSILDREEFAKLETALWKAESRLHRVRSHVGDSTAIKAAEQLVSEAAAALNHYIAAQKKGRETT